MVLSRNTRSRGSNMAPKMTSDGKFLCEGDNKASIRGKSMLGVVRKRMLAAVSAGR